MSANNKCSPKGNCNNLPRESNLLISGRISSIVLLLSLACAENVMWYYLCAFVSDPLFCRFGHSTHAFAGVEVCLFNSVMLSGMSYHYMSFLLFLLLSLLVIMFFIG